MKRIAFWLFVFTAQRGRSPFNEELLSANNEVNERFDFRWPLRVRFSTRLTRLELFPRWQYSPERSFNHVLSPHDEVLCMTLPVSVPNSELKSCI